MEKIDFEEVFPKLIKMEIFSGFKSDSPTDKQILKKVYEHFSLKEFKSGETIIKEGDYGELFYLLLSGKVQVFKKTLSGDQIAIANLDASQYFFFGENALIGKDTRSATVKALTDCKTCTLSGKKFQELSEHEPTFGYRVLLRLSRRLCQTIRKADTDMATLYEALFSEIENYN